MKVENSPLNPLAAQPKTEGVHSTEKNPRLVDAAVSSGSKDKAQFSEQARILAKARIALDEAPDVRAERVAEVRKKIADGTYQIPHGELASRMLPRLIRQ